MYIHFSGVYECICVCTVALIFLISLSIDGNGDTICFVQPKFCES